MKKKYKMLPIKKNLNQPEFDRCSDEELLSEFDEYTLSGEQKYEFMRLVLAIIARHKQLLYQLNQGWRTV